MGDNELGFNIRCATATHPGMYVDFKWITVERTQGIDFAEVEEVIISILGLITEWEKPNGDLIEWGFSPGGLADVTFDGTSLSGRSTITEDSVWVHPAGTSFNFYCETRESLGGFGPRDVTFSGSITGTPEINDNSVSVSVSGGAVKSALSTLDIDAPSGYTYLDCRAESNTTLSIIFRF